MYALGAPVVQVISYAAALEHFGHSVGRPPVFPWATAGREVDVATRVLVEKPRVEDRDDFREVLRDHLAFLFR